MHSLNCKYVLSGKRYYSAVLQSLKFRLWKLLRIKYVHKFKKNDLLPISLMGGMWGPFFFMAGL